MEEVFEVKSHEVKDEDAVNLEVPILSNRVTKVPKLNFQNFPISQNAQILDNKCHPKTLFLRLRHRHLVQVVMRTNLRHQSGLLPEDLDYEKDHLQDLRGPTEKSPLPAVLIMK